MAEELKRLVPSMLSAVGPENGVPEEDGSGSLGSFVEHLARGFYARGFGVG